MTKKTIELHCVTDDYYFSNNNRFIKQIESILEGGADIIQLRFKAMTKHAFYSLAKQIKKITLSYQRKLLINDHVDLALAIDADGVHLGQQDLPINIARQLLGPDKCIGISINSLKQTHLALSQSIDYLSISPLFSTQTKKDATPPLGLEALSEIKKLTDKKIITIGGITLSNCSQVINHGANGIAVCSAIFNSTNAFKESQKFRRQLDKNK